MGGKRKNSGSFSKLDESGAKKSDDCDSQEELDGSDTSALKWNSTNNGVRYSARVMEKQEKLRRESSPAKQIVADSSGQNTLSSNISPPSILWKAGMKHGSTDDSFGHCSSDHGQLNVSSSTGLSFAPSTIAVCSSGPGVLDEKHRKKRNWELWSQDDKQLFFDALNDFGKDFDAIQNHLACKLRPKNKLGSTAISVAANQFIPKNKDQVRHFYYRTWNKISKFLTFPKDMKKAFQELYGLVNYGELRKKQRVLNLKTAAKLSELVEKGTTTIKVRGKTFRIKTPVCRALKRLNRLDDVEHARVPCKLSLELNAKDGTAWAAVQGVSHNPRVKVYVPLQRTLASVISYFEERWKTSSDRLKEQFLHTIGRKTVPRLRFIPTDKRDMNLPIFKISEVTSSAKLSLRSFTEKVLKERDKTTDIFVKNKKRQGVSNPEDPISETDLGDLDPSDSGMTTTTAVTFFKNTNRFGPNEPSMSIVTQLGSPTDKGLLSPNRQKYSSNDVVHISEDNLTFTSKESPASDICSCPPSTKGEEDFLSHVCDEETARRGWTVDEAGTLTCGELYLMLGQSDKLCFEYYWDKGENISPNRNEEIKLIDRLVEVARLLKKRKTLARSNSKLPWPMLCSKCGYRPELTPNNLRPLPINTQTRGSPHPSTTCEQTIRLLSEEFEAHQQSIYHGLPEVKLHSAQISGGSSVEVGVRKIHESFVSTRHEGTDLNTETFRRPRPIIPKETMASPVVPPKPFLDLPKGNRRIGRPILKRIVVPRVLPLRPKTPELSGMYSISIPGPTAVRPVTFPSSNTSNLGGAQILASSKSDIQQINLLNILKPSTSVSSEKNSTVDKILKHVQADSCTSVGSNEFEDLLKLGQDKLSTDSENSFSLSSFMDISIPESSQLAAAVCLNSKKFLNESVEQSSSCSLSLSNFLDTCGAQKVESDSTLNTSMKLGTHEYSQAKKSSLAVEPWLNSTNTNDPSDLSLSSLLGTFDAAVRSNNTTVPLPTSDVNFQSVVGEGSLNFLTKYSERATKLSNNNKQDEK